MAVTFIPGDLADRVVARLFEEETPSRLDDAL